MRRVDSAQQVALTPKQRTGHSESKDHQRPGRGFRHSRPRRPEHHLVDEGGIIEDIVQTLET